MSLQDRKDKLEEKIKNVFDDVTQRTSDVRNFIKNSLEIADSTGAPYPGGWDKWLLARLQGIVLANKILLEENDRLIEIERAITAEQEHAERMRIRREADAAKRIKDEQDAERVAIALTREMKEAEERAAAAAALEDIRIKEEEEAALIAENEEAARVTAANEAIRAAREARIAELNAFVIPDRNDTKNDRNKRAIALLELFRLGEIESKEILSRRITELAEFEYATPL